MKQFILKYNDSVLYFFLLVMALFPVLPMVVESILMFGGFLFSLFYFIIEGKNFWTKNKTIQLILFSSLFLTFAFSLLYTQDIQRGIKFIIRLLPTILFPSIFLFNKINTLETNRFNKIITAYCGAIFLALVYLHIVLFHKLYNSSIKFWDFRQLIELKLKVHGTYLAMWVGFAIVLLVHNIKSQISKSEKYYQVFLMFIMLAYFFYWQYVIGSRMPFLATIIVCFFCLFKNVKQMLLAGILLFFLSTVLVLKTDRIGERFQKLKNYDFSFPQGKYEDNYPNISNEQIRNGIYYCSYETLKEEPFFGHGVGDVDARLQSCYDNTFTNTDTYKVTNYNSHNEYLNIILSAGIIGLILFLVANFYFIKKAFNKKSGIYISFMLFIFLNFCFENILSRHNGVVFFSFFNSLIFFQYNSLHEKGTN